MIDLLIFLVIAVVLTGTGRKCVSLIVETSSLSVLEKSLIGYGMGIGMLVLTVLLIGLGGLLYREALMPVVLILAVLFRKSVIQTVKDLETFSLGLLKAKVSFFERFLIAAIGFVAFFTLIGSLSPLLGMDSAAYHMQDPKLFVQAHAIFRIPYTRDSLWPFFVQTLFTFALCLKGVILAKLFHFSFYVTTFLAIYALCRRYLPRRSCLLAAAIFSLTPAIFTVTTYAYTDLAVTFYTIISFYCFFVWRDTSQMSWFALSGIMSGFLLGIKLPSAIVPALILVLYFVSMRAMPFKKEKFLGAGLFLGGMFLACCIWYIRSWIILGNPIYPFAAKLFGGHGYPESVLGYQTTAGFGLGIIPYFFMLWPLTMSPDIFGGESLGVVFLIFLPMVVFVRSFPKFMLYVLAIALGLYSSWFIVYQYTRFFFSTLIFLSILVAFIYQELSMDPWVRKVATALLIGIFCYSAALSVYHNVDKIRVAFGLEKREDFLRGHERSYDVAEYVNSHLPQDAKVLNLNEPRLFYFRRDIAMLNLIKLDPFEKGCWPQGESLEEHLRLLGFGKYMLYMKDYSVNGHFETLLTPEKLFVNYKKTLETTVEFVCRNERYVYELWKIGEMVPIPPKTPR